MYQEWTKFKLIREKMMKNYRDHISKTQVIKNIIYLLDYDELIKIGPNSSMSSDDYLHLLIILSGYPGIASPKRLNEELSKLLVRFTLELILSGSKDYIYYLPLFPKDSLLN